jgi:ribulose-phosphate 3-epimerase
MEIIPVINCDDFNCVKDKFVKLDELILSPPKKVHIDISDGEYALRPKWNQPEALKEFLIGNKLEFSISVHFMVKKPSIDIENWSSIIAKAIIPLDCDEDVDDVALLCRERKIVPVLSVSPSVPIEKALKHSSVFNDFQILAVSPGPSGQEMSQGTLDKIEFLKSQMPSVIIEVDGGVNPATASLFKKAGADIILSGSYIFNSADPKSAYLELKEA